MAQGDLLNVIPEAAKILGGWITGIFSFWLTYRQYKKKQVATKQQLLKEYKDMYIKQSMELINLLQSDAKKRKVLIEMKNFCPECYEQVTQKIGYEEPDEEN